MLAPEGTAAARVAAQASGEAPLFGAASLSLDPALNQPGAAVDNWSRWDHAGLSASRGSLEALRDRNNRIKALESEGANAVGLNLEWARIAPAPGAMDEAALAAYAELLSACHESGLQPVITLHHRSHPAWLGEEFWLTPGSPDLFAAYVKQVLTWLSDLCRHWVTLFSPGRLAADGWINGTVPPCRRAAISDAYVVVDNLMAAHVLAAAEIRAACPDATVAIGNHASDLYDEGPLLMDLLLELSRRNGRTRASELGQWLSERRAEYHRLHPPQRPREGLQRAAARLLSPFGRRLGRRLSHREMALPTASIRRRFAEFADNRFVPNTYRSVTAMFENSVGAPDAVALTWDLPAGRAALIEWCRMEARRHGRPFWILMPGDEALMPSRGELMTLRTAERYGIPITGWLRLVPGALLLPGPS